LPDGYPAARGPALPGPRRSRRGVNADATARFNFSNAAPAAIRDGISRIGGVLRRMIRTTTTA
jgi:DNA-binding transcriptional MocR family regulator